jgi:hypothetical protein
MMRKLKHFWIFGLVGVLGFFLTCQMKAPNQPERSMKVVLNLKMVNPARADSSFSPSRGFDRGSMAKPLNVQTISEVKVVFYDFEADLQTIVEQYRAKSAELDSLWSAFPGEQSDFEQYWIARDQAEFNIVSAGNYWLEKRANLTVSEDRASGEFELSEGTKTFTIGCFEQGGLTHVGYPSGNSGFFENHAEENDTVDVRLFQVTIITTNNAPYAVFGVTPTTGAVDTVFMFDASDSWDAEDSADLLEVRWDWETDGTWDTDYSTNKVATHQYTTVGSYTVTLEVKDTEGSTDQTTRTVTVTAPQPATEWDQTFGGAQGESGRFVEQTQDGGYVITGYTYSYGAGNADVYLVKTDANGNEQWSQTYGGNMADVGCDVSQTGDGGYVIVGYTQSYGVGGTDFWLIKTDANGNEQWNRTFGGQGNDWSFSGHQTQDGGFIMTGYTSSYGAGNLDVWLVKTDATGDEQWSQTFGDSLNDGGECVRQMQDGGFIITGMTESYGEGVSDVWLIRTDADGNEEWSSTFGGSDEDQGYSVQETQDGGFIVAGATRSYSTSGNDAWLIKMNNNGGMIWEVRFGEEWNEDNARSVQQTVDGGYVMVGSTSSYGAGDSDVWLIKTDANGNEEMNQVFGEEDTDYGYSVQQTQDGGYIIAGDKAFNSTAGGDIWLIKVSP